MGIYVGETPATVKGKNRGITASFAINALTSGVSPRTAKFTAFA